MCTPAGRLEKRSSVSGWGCICQFRQTARNGKFPGEPIDRPDYLTEF
jgi:hypothetical protein